MNSFQITELPIKTEILKSQVIHFESLDSTNTYLLSRHPHPSGSIIWADFQSAGRGRLGRTWLAPRDEALLFSIYLKIQDQATPLFIYPFLTAVGVLEAVQTVVPPAWLTLKWPNDVLLKNLKICGILVQTKTRSVKNNDVVIGIGLNINQKMEFFCPELPYAGSLYSITGKKYEPLSLLAELVRSIDRNLTELNKSGAGHILQKWRSHCPYFGQKLKVNDGRQIHVGIFKDITENGGLVLLNGQASQVFHAADVTIMRES